MNTDISEYLYGKVLIGSLFQLSADVVTFLTVPTLQLFTHFSCDLFPISSCVSSQPKGRSENTLKKVNLVAITRFT
jgi:hypothetical protein